MSIARSKSPAIPAELSNYPQGVSRFAAFGRQKVHEAFCFPGLTGYKPPPEVPA
jgi:hypothetical protein